MSRKKRKETKVREEGKSNFLTRNTDLPLIIATVLLILIGLITLLSASSSKGLSVEGDAYFFVKRQVRYLVFGLVAAVVLTFIDYRKYNNIALLGLIGMGIFASLVLVKVSGIDEGGAARWVNIGGINFQPSEFIKLGMIIIIAGLLARTVKEGEIKTFGKGFAIPLALAGVVAILVLVWQTHLSAAFIIGLITVTQMFVAGSNIIYLLGLLILGVLGLVYVLSGISPESESFRAARVLAWKDPYKYSQGAGWQILQSLYAIGSGGIIGLGIGQSRQKQDFLPEPQNDFIASIFAEEFGFIGVTTLIAIFAILIIRAIMIARNTDDLFGKLIAIGITMLFASEIILNFLVITNLMPVTGIGLPFFSYGGTAMIANLMAIGVLMSIHRNSQRKE